MNIAYYIARHLYKGDNTSQKVSRPAVRIAMLGIALGIIVMIVSVCVILGFKHTVRDKIVGFNSHIIVSNFMTLQTNDQTHPINANDSLIRKIAGVEGVRHVQRYSLKQGVLKTDSDFLGVVFKGVGEDYDNSFLSTYIVGGNVPVFKNDNKTSTSSRDIIVSKTIANKLHLNIGSKVFAYFMNDDDVRMRPFVVKGVYQTNMSKYDDVMCFVDIRTVSKLNGWELSPNDNKYEVTGCELIVNNFDSLDYVEEGIIDKINKTEDSDGHPLSSLTVYDLSPQTFSWLELLDLNVWVIMMLMISVACVTIVSGLLIIILERTSMIGLLKSLGARDSLVRKTFRWLALYIVAKGLLIGNVIAIVICLVQKYFGIVKLDATVYYVSEVPIEFNIPLILLLDVCTLLLTTAILILPSYYVSTIHPAKTMRIE